MTTEQKLEAARYALRSFTARVANRVYTGRLSRGHAARTLVGLRAIIEDYEKQLSSERLL